jgi:hypothetical protein
MAQIKNSSEVKANKLFSGIYDFKYVFKDKNFFEVKEGDVLYSRGDKSEYMYLLLRGRIKLKTYENPRLPKIFLISKNEFFGEKELIEKTVRNSSALAEKDSLLFKMSQKDFLKLSTTNKKIMENLKEKKYEEVVAPSRKNEIKDDIFKKILNEPDQKKKPPERKGNGIELKDYSYENPLLELKARDEITDELKMYDEDKDDIVNTDPDLEIDDDGIKWELQESLEDDEKSSVFDEDEETLTEPEIPSEEAEEDVLENFMKIQDQVNTFSDSLDENEENSFSLNEEQETELYSDDDQDTGSAADEDQPDPEHNALILNDYQSDADIDKYVNSDPKPFVFEDDFPKDNFIKAVTKLSSGLTREEIDRLVVDTAVELVNAEQGILYYPDSENKLKGKLVEEDAELVAGAGTIPEKCFLNGQLINIKDVFNDANFNPAVDYISYFHIHSLICMPVSDGEKLKPFCSCLTAGRENFPTPMKIY